ncbi:MAG: UDP-N-acetylmuramate--L-alanine ligase [Acidobacteria bacterium]|nr:UDP-N-acetylmuramate--L-alanine ligase [Acidobacteriota bacterium]
MTTVVITGGGTSGHVLPAIAIAEMLEDRGVAASDIHIVGTLRGVDGQILGDTEYPHTLLPVTGLARSLRPRAIVGNLGSAARLAAARRTCRALLADLRPDIVVSVGGYGSLAAMHAARSLGIRTVVVSYDSRPGLATRRQAQHADTVTVADPTSPLDDAILTGAPVRRAVRGLDRGAERERARRLLGLPADGFVVGVMGGSLGSGVLNGIVESLSTEPPDALRDVWWYHVTGPRFATPDSSTERHIRVPYQHDITALYAACDIVVTRAGASTVAEIATVGIPAVIVPWAGAAENHQEHNARQLSSVGGAVLVTERELSTDRLAAEIVALRSDPARRERLAAAAHMVGDIHRGPRLVDAILGTGRTQPTAVVDLGSRRRLHVVGIGGPGMSALARALHGAGHVVSGSDVRESDVVAALRAEGIDVSIGHRASLVDGCDAVCASSGVPADNIEMAAARERGIPALTRADMLAAICAQGPTLAVAGTHGKTSTSALLAVMLGGAGKVGFVVGGDAPDLGTNGAWVQGRPFVVEADESDGTHEKLPVTAAILTNVDVDHLDHFGSVGAIGESFERFARSVEGPLVLCADDAVLSRLAHELRAIGRDVVTYGEAEEADVRVSNVVQGVAHLTFDIDVSSRARDMFEEGRVSVALRAHGRHYALNATAALVLALRFGARLDDCLAAMSSFRGVGRRFEIRGERSGAVLVDDYAHLPTEIAAVLGSTRSGAFAGRRLVAVFQPNRFHRMAAMSDEYRDAFVAADVVFVTDIYASGTQPIPGVTGRLVVDAIVAAHPGTDVRWCPTRNDLITAVVDELREGDACVSFGCGDIETFPDDVMVEADVRRIVVDLRASGVDVAEHSPMGERTTYKTGGAARALVTVHDVDQLATVAASLRNSAVPVVVLGRGSNMLVSDVGFGGLCLVLGDFATGVRLVGDVRPDVDVVVEVGGATPLPVAARQLSSLGVSGFEWAVGVPGTVGGAVRMNAGGHGSDMVASLVDVDVVDLRTGRASRLGVKDLGLRFRGSDLDDHHVVVSVRMVLRGAVPGCGDEKIADIVRWRRDNQPGGQNAGSVFVNPDNGARSAGEIIDRLGLRGLRIGGAAVSDKHANFIQADPGALSTDVVRVMLEVHRRVLEAEGLSLRSEVRLVGFPPGLPFAGPAGEEAQKR